MEAPDRRTGWPKQQRGLLLHQLLRPMLPSNYLVGVIDDHRSAQRGARALMTYGFARRDVILRTGVRIAESLSHADFERLIREATTEEGSLCRDYVEQARGGAVLTVSTPTPEDVRRACHILTAYGAHSMLHFSDWEVLDLVPGEGCWPPARRW